MNNREVLLTGSDINTILVKVAESLTSDIKNMQDFAIIGIQTRGVELAERLKKLLLDRTGSNVSFGYMDITFHRDDLSTRGALPVIKETKIDFSIEGKTVLLVDDVIYTGRSINAAIDTLMDFGRPKAIKLFALIDRGGRELPIQPDYFGKKIASTLDQQIDVTLKNTDGSEDQAMVISKE